MCRVLFFKQETAYEMRISDWRSDVCSSDLQSLAEEVQPVCRVGDVGELTGVVGGELAPVVEVEVPRLDDERRRSEGTSDLDAASDRRVIQRTEVARECGIPLRVGRGMVDLRWIGIVPPNSRTSLLSRSEEHPSELQSLMRTSYAVFS